MRCYDLSFCWKEKSYNCNRDSQLVESVTSSTAFKESSLYIIIKSYSLFMIIYDRLGSFNAD